VADVHNKTNSTGFILSYSVMAFFFVTSTITDLLKNSNLMRVLMTVHFYDLGERILERILSSAFHLLRMKIRIDFLPHVFLPLRFSISKKRYFGN